VQFSYSLKVHEDLTRKGKDGKYRPIDDVFRDWGITYAKGLLFGKKGATEVYNRCQNRQLVSLFAGYIHAITKLLNVVNFPASDWHVYINDMLSGIIPNYLELNYTAPRHGMPDAALVQQLALPPDSWVGKGDDTRQVSLEMPEGWAKGTTIPFAHVSKSRTSELGYDGFLVPLYQPGPYSRAEIPLVRKPFRCDCSWTMRYACPEDAHTGGGKTVWRPKWFWKLFGSVAEDDQSACYSYCCGSLDMQQRTRSAVRGIEGTPDLEKPEEIIPAIFPTPAETKLHELTAMSSAAGGAGTCPYIIKKAMKQALRGTLQATKNKNGAMMKGSVFLIELANSIGMKPSDGSMTAAFYRWATGEDTTDDFLNNEVDGFVDDCMPFGLDHLGVDLSLHYPKDETVTLDEPDSRSWIPGYRGMDGVYVENTALAMTIATMIRDCEAGDATLDCRDKSFDIILVNDGDKNPTFNGLGPFFSDTGKPVGSRVVAGPGGLTMVPSPMIFAEKYPRTADSECKLDGSPCWINYYTSTGIADFFGSLDDPLRLPDEIISGIANGRLGAAAQNDISNFFGARGAPSAAREVDTSCKNGCAACKPGCGWTADWACPSQKKPGKKGYAKPDGSSCFNFCCIVQEPGLKTLTNPVTGKAVPDVEKKALAEAEADLALFQQMGQPEGGLLGKAGAKAFNVADEDSILEVFDVPDDSEAASSSTGVGEDYVGDRGILDSMFGKEEEAPRESRYKGSNLLRGTFTTIDNPAWGLKAGYKVNLLAFCILYPQDPLLQGGIGIDNDPIILPPLTAATFFDSLYAPIAHTEIDSATPFLKEWLRGVAKRREMHQVAQKLRLAPKSSPTSAALGNNAVG